MANSAYEVEFKLEDPAKKWEDTPVYQRTYYTLDKEQSAWGAECVGRYIARTQGKKVRWNFKGGTQGHYIEVPEAAK